MIGTIAPKLAALPGDHKRLWPELRAGVALGYVLYGDTAVSLHLGHRAAAGFELYRARRLDHEAIRKSYPFMQKATVLEDGEDTLAVLVPGRGRSPVKVCFRGGQACGRIGDPLLTQDGVLEIASLDDLMAHKVKTLLDRQDRTDYEDIAAMIRAGCSVSRALAGARTLFGKAFQPAAAVEALSSFGGGELATLSRADRGTLASAARVIGILPSVKLRSRGLALPVRAQERGARDAGVKDEG